MYCSYSAQGDFGCQQNQARMKQIPNMEHFAQEDDDEDEYEGFYVKQEGAASQMAAKAPAGQQQPKVPVYTRDSVNGYVLAPNGSWSSTYLKNNVRQECEHAMYVKGITQEECRWDSNRRFL